MRKFSVLLVGLFASLTFCLDANAQHATQTLFHSESLEIDASLSLDEFSANVRTKVDIPFTNYSFSMIVSTVGVVVIVDDNEKPHRGRIQIQGPDMDPEISWAWAQDTPPTKADGLRELDRLYNSLSKSQKKVRTAAYDKARKWIRGLPEDGVGPVSKSWGNQEDTSKRIDIEVIKGKAFTGADPEAEDETIEVGEFSNER